ncbi:tail protein [Spirochaetia bacterium]|nr:tail protein [Spirochaetia bacterium]
MSNMITLFLRDRNKDIVDEWTRVFAGYKNVDISCGDIFDIKADAIISPANSFGFMDGGIDLAYSKYFGWKLQKALQEKINTEYYGELPVGAATIIETGNADIPYLISCPTMRIPENVENTVNAYLAFRAALIEVIRFNAESANKISSILCPGLGTLTGSITPVNCATQMIYAYDTILNKEPLNYNSLFDAYTIHQVLTGKLK